MKQWYALYVFLYSYENDMTVQPLNFENVSDSIPHLMNVITYICWD